MEPLCCSNIVINGISHPHLTGMLYAKPEPGVVLAHLYNPSSSPLPGVSACQPIRLSALCANGKPMTDIAGWVTSTARMGDHYRYHLALYRNGYALRPVPQYATHLSAYTRKGLRKLMREHLWYHRLVRRAGNWHEQRLVFDRIFECGLALQLRPNVIAFRLREVAGN